jgi:hypothetical protein
LSRSDQSQGEEGCNPILYGKYKILTDQDLPKNINFKIENISSKLLNIQNKYLELKRLTDDGLNFGAIKSRFDGAVSPG